MIGITDYAEASQLHLNTLLAAALTTKTCVCLSSVTGVSVVKAILRVFCKISGEKKWQIVDSNGNVLG
jgi:hypothetical protein